MEVRLQFVYLCVCVRILSVCDTPASPKKCFTLPRALWIDFICSVLLLIEVIVGSIAIGFAGASSTWLRCSMYHQIDFLVLLSSATNLALAFVFSWTELFTLRPFRLFQLFKVLSVFRHLSYIKYILKALIQGGARMGTVVSVLAFAILFFGVLGSSI
jgi:hypothetical protein